MQNFYNEDYERYILGCMLLDNSLIDLIKGKLGRDEFYSEKNKTIFSAIIADWDEKKGCTLLTLVSRLTEFAAVEIASLTDSVTTVVNWEFYVDEVKKLYKTRMLRADLSNAIEKLSTENVADITNHLDSSLTSYMTMSKAKAHTMAELCPMMCDFLDEAYNRNGDLLGVSTGWENLDDILNGMQLGKLSVIAARPSVGKTAFSMQLARNIAVKGNSICYFSLEMTAKSLMTRLVAQETGIKIGLITSGLAMRSTQSAQKLNIGLNSLYTYPMQIYDDSIRDENDLIGRIRVQAKLQGTKYFIVDHIGLVRHSNPQFKRYEQIDDITQKLLHTAQDLNVGIIILCQLKRDAEGNEPTLSDLRDSGTIEQNADICMFIHRKRATGGEFEIPTKLMVIKNREGACGTANMLFRPDLTKFFVDKNPQPEEPEKKKSKASA